MPRKTGADPPENSDRITDRPSTPKKWTGDRFSGKCDTEEGKQILEKAIELADGYEHISAINSISAAYVKLGDKSKGYSILSKALSLTSSITSKSDYNDKLTSIALAYVNVGPDPANGIPNSLARTLAKTVKPEISSSSTNRDIGILHAELGNWGEALRFSKHCQVDDKVSVLVRILRVNAEQKHPEWKELRSEK